MRKILLASVAIASLAAVSAQAADLPARAPAMAPAPVFVGVNWTGLYVGAQVGYAWNEIKNVDFPESANPHGVFGGLHAGYNQQFNNIVLGLEGDVELSGVQKKLLGGDKFQESYRASLRLRAGYAIDRALLYVTAGGAMRDGKFSFPGASLNETYFGWTVGAGLEYAINQNWSARAEYRYTDFGRANYGIAPDQIRVSSTDHAVRLGVSYRFGGFGGPVVAKY